MLRPGGFVGWRRRFGRGGCEGGVFFVGHGEGIAWAWELEVRGERFEERLTIGSWNGFMSVACWLMGWGGMGFGFGFGFGLILYGMIGIAGFWSWRVSSALWFVDEMGWDGTGVFLGGDH